MKTKVLIVLGFLSLLLAMPFRVMAQTPEIGSQTPTVVNNRAVVTLAELGYVERDLVSPVDSTRIRFSIPPSWHLLPDGDIELNYDVVLSGTDVIKIENNKNPYGGNLIVSLNGQIIGTIPLDETGSHTARLKIPASALVSTEKDGSHLLVISLNAQFSCIYDIRAVVSVKANSFFELAFEPAEFELDLSKLPAPFYDNNSFIPESTLVVLPDNPDALEIQAALDIMAGFGSMAGGTYDINLINAGQLSTIDLAQYNIIFVGKPDQLSALSNINFQLSVVNGQFVNMPPESTEDGVIQLAHSPWNPNKAIMMVSGNSNEAVVRAAQALSTGSVLVYKDLAIAYVSNVQLLSQNVPTVEYISLQNLGYGTKTLSGIGVYSTEYSFNVSQEQISTKDGYIDFVYYHAGLVNYEGSSVSISLNRQMIVSVPFSKESEQVTTLRLKIPAGMLNFGKNLLQATVSMPAYTQAANRVACDHTGLSKPWLVISDQTMIHIPKATIEVPAKPLLNDLRRYSDYFAKSNDLGDIAFVLAKSDPVSWNIAGKLAFKFGDSKNPPLPNLVVAYADDVPQDIRNKKSLIVVGLASQLPLLTEFNDLLPAPFDLTNNTATERSMRVIYRIPEGVSVGYLQLMSSPYNPDLAILVVSGNSVPGLVFAGNGLTLSDLQSQLAGVFAVTNGTQIATGNLSIPVPVDTVVPNSEQVVATPVPGFMSETPESVRPSWPVPVIIVTSVIVVVVIGFGVRAFVNRKVKKPWEE